ncbi:Glycosyl hydrolases family 2, sugar binding domain protein [Verrucomicrobiia bacterium DG1235]|nr:Glycosyl hydrolases family 2, sugar binding domain protein [Verrucomicrobiae bacterium DG1235]
MFTEEIDKSKKKKCESSNAFLPVLVAVATALGGTGLIGMFDDDDDGAGANAKYPASSSFITKETRSLAVDLEGDWRFSIGDDVRWAEPRFDDSSWSTVDVPADWEGEGYRGYDGYAWYRRTFRIESEDTERSLYAFVGRVDEVDEVFVNGRRIGGEGRFLPDCETAWNRDRVYRVPDGLVRAGDDNLIAVRVYDAEQGGGIVRGEVGLYATDLPQPLIDLAGDWKFRTGDDSSWKESGFDDSGFSRIHVPIAWDAVGYADFDGYAWYRKGFGRLAVSEGESLVLLLGKIDDTDEVFLNGVSIGRTGNLDASDRASGLDFYQMSRAYEFSASLLSDSNVLAVRVHDDRGFGGIYTGPVGIMTAAAWSEYQAMQEAASKWDFARVMDWLMGRK